jgi:hypothetical protein
VPVVKPVPNGAGDDVTLMELDDRDEPSRASSSGGSTAPCSIDG